MTNAVGKRVNVLVVVVTSLVKDVQRFVLLKLLKEKIFWYCFEFNIMSYRSKIANALVDKLKEIDGTGDWVSDLYNNVHKKLKFCPLCKKKWEIN